MILPKAGRWAFWLFFTHLLRRRKSRNKQERNKKQSININQPKTMAKIVYAPEIEYMSGKLCKKSKSMVYHYKKSGRNIRCDYHEREDPNTTNQQQVRAIFTARVNAAKTWYNANKPSTTNANGTADFQKVKAAFDKSNYDNIFSFVRSLVAGTTPAVVVPGGSTTTSGGTGDQFND